MNLLTAPARNTEIMHAALDAETEIVSTDIVLTRELIISRVIDMKFNEEEFNYFIKELRKLLETRIKLEDNSLHDLKLIAPKEYERIYHALLMIHKAWPHIKNDPTCKQPFVNDLLRIAAEQKTTPRRILHKVLGGLFGALAVLTLLAAILAIAFITDGHGGVAITSAFMSLPGTLLIIVGSATGLYLGECFYNRHVDALVAAMRTQLTTRYPSNQLHHQWGH